MYGSSAHSFEIEIEIESESENEIGFCLQLKRTKANPRSQGLSDLEEDSLEVSSHQQKFSGMVVHVTCILCLTC